MNLHQQGTGGDPDDQGGHSCKKMNITAANVSTVNIDCIYGCSADAGVWSYYSFADVDTYTHFCAYDSCQYGVRLFQNVSSIEFICANKGCLDTELIVADASTVVLDCLAVGENCFGDNDGDTSFYFENAGNIFVHEPGHQVTVFLAW